MSLACHLHTDFFFFKGKGHHKIGTPRSQQGLALKGSDWQQGWSPCGEGSEGCGQLFLLLTSTSQNWNDPGGTAGNGQKKTLLLGGLRLSALSPKTLCIGKKKQDFPFPCSGWWLPLVGAEVGFPSPVVWLSCGWVWMLPTGWPLTSSWWWDFGKLWNLEGVEPHWRSGSSR